MKTPCFLLRRGDINRWRLNVRDKFEYQKSQCSIACGPSNEIPSPRRGPLNHGCGTHIKIRFSAEYSLHIPQLKNIARAIIYFEPAFEDLLPKYRRGYAYAKSNGSRIRNASGNGHMAIENAETEYAIVKLMQSLRQTGSENERNPDSDKHLFDLDYACNFNRLNDREIEFRNAPACASGEETVRWAELILSLSPPGKPLVRSWSSTAAASEVSGSFWIGILCPEKMTPVVWRYSGRKHYVGKKELDRY
jgi:hypothetical protein